MNVEKYINTYTHSKLKPEEIKGMLRDLDDPGLTISREEKRMKREALNVVFRKIATAIVLLISTFAPAVIHGQTIAKGSILITENPYYVEIRDYQDGQWKWLNWDRFDYARYSIKVNADDRIDWRIITCSDTTNISIYGQPEKTKLDVAIVHDGGFHTIGTDPNPNIK